MFARPPTLRELVYLAIEAAAGAAAFQESQREGAADDADRVGTPRWRSHAFFKSLPPEDIHALAVVYWAARDHDDESTTEDAQLSQMKDLMNTVTRCGDADKTREVCLRKLTEIMGDNIVHELSRALSTGLIDSAEAIRREFRNYERDSGQSLPA